MGIQGESCGEAGALRARLEQRSIAGGALLWVLFGVGAVVVRGVRWEESFEFGQVLLGLIPYPEGHPTFQHVHNSFCLQTYLTAAMMWLNPNPVIVCGFRNVLYILAKTLPFYLCGAWLSRRVLVGHVSALLALLTAQGFTNAYESYMWPVMSSNGVVGLGVALTALCFLTMESTWTAYFMIGLMPAIHLGQFPPLLVVACVHLADCWRRRPDTVLRRALPGLAAGLAITGATMVVFLLTRVPPPTRGPYFAEIPWIEVWRGFMASYNFHRDLRLGEDQIILVWMTLLGAATVWLEWRKGDTRGPWFWIALYGWTVSLTVWGTMAVHYVLGTPPPVLINWMPYRLPNHLVPLLVPMMTALIVGDTPSRGMSVLVLAALVAAGFGVHGNVIYLALCGITTQAVFVRLNRDRNLARLWDLLVTVGCLMLWMAFGRYAFYWVGGWLVAAAASCTDAIGRSGRGTAARWRRLAVGGCTVVVAVTLYNQWKQNDAVVERLTRMPFEEAVHSYLDDRREPNAMIAVPPIVWRLQERLGHPVITDAATPSWIPYHRSLGPSLWKLYRDLYDIDLASVSGGGIGPWFAHYQQVWARRSPTEWQALAHEYDFGYLIAPTTITLQLPVAVEGDLIRLYAVPRG